MTGKARRSLPVLQPRVPGRAWRWTRRITLAIPWFALMTAPLLGGWQRLERNYMSAWEEHGWDLPVWLLKLLPKGQAPANAYAALELVGGGSGVDYLGVPVVDPASGVLPVLQFDPTWTLVMAWLLPVLIGLVAGRWFCGWFCPFGSLSRVLHWSIRALRWRPIHYRLATRRWFRYVVLGLALGLGTLGLPSLIALLLPHAVLQQAAYSAWLMGGGGAALGWLLGLILAGVLLGPNAYCATLCPTGTSLSLLGRSRALRITLDDVDACGRNCNLCSRACWLGLDPASGDPGPDCDTCAQCFRVCPTDNLRVGLAVPKRLRALPLTSLLVAGLLTSAGADADQRTTSYSKPSLLLEARTHVGDVTASVSVVSGADTHIDRATLEPSISEVSLFIVRGDRLPADQQGRLPLRDYYAGPLGISIERRGEVAQTVRLSEPSAPISAPRRAIYRFPLTNELAVGDSLALEPIDGWTPRRLTWTIQPGRSDSLPSVVTVAASMALFLGLLSLALATGRSLSSQDERRGRATRA